MIVRDNIPFGYTYDSNNNLLTYKDSYGYWSEYTYNINNNVLTYKNSTGNWCEYTYNINNNVLTYKDSYGYFKVLIQGQDYTLMYDEDKKLYRAGCQNLNYNDCKKYFKLNKENYIDSILFMKTIKKHQISIA